MWIQKLNSKTKIHESYIYIYIKSDKWKDFHEK